MQPSPPADPGEKGKRDKDRKISNRRELLRYAGLSSEVMASIGISVFLGIKADEWLKLLNSAEVPCAPVQTVDQVFNAPQVLHREMLVEVEHPTAGSVRMAGIPVKFSATPASVRLSPPLLGQHTKEVLASWLGMNEKEISELKEKSVI